MAAEKRGDLSAAEAMFVNAERLAESLGSKEDVAACLEHRGTLARMQGDGAGSLSFLERARSIYDALGYERRTSDCLREMGGTLSFLGDSNRAVAVLREAIARYDRGGYATESAACLNNVGEALRATGDLAGAEEAYQEALETMERLGSHAGRCQAAAEAAGYALDLAERTGRRWAASTLHAAFLPGLAEAADWAGWDRHCAAVERILAETGYVDPDIVWVADLAADRAAVAGEMARSLQAREIARAQRAALEVVR
jgi:tetratricopeptide (TPR) repeat protein